MSLRTYAGACNQLVAELKESLSKPEIDALRNDCASLGFDNWLSWHFENLEEIREYAAAVPSRRAKLKKWRDPILKGRLVLGCIYHIQGGCNMLRALCEYDLSPGYSYRDMAWMAGEAYQRVCFVYKNPEWPFDGPDPFLNT